MKSAKMPTPNPKSRIDFALLVHRLLSFARYGRLALILSCLGSLGGVIIYAYSVPVYFSRTVINWQVFGIPFRDGGEARETGISPYNVWRDLKTQLEADQLVKDVAIKLKVATVADDITRIRDYIKMSRLSFRDYQTLVLEVAAYDPRIVKEYCPALIEAYQDQQASQRRKYREKALDKYRAEIENLNAKVDEDLKNRLAFERKNEAATLSIKQKTLLMLPLEIERCKAQLKRMEQIREDFAREAKSLDTISKLSLLSAFDKEWKEGEKAKTGDMVRNSSGTGAPLITTLPQKLNLDVVVKPELEEGSEPWRRMERDYRALQEEIAQQSRKYLPGHEVMRKLNDREAELKSNLESELVIATKRFDVEHQRLKARVPELEAQLPEYHDTVEKYETFQLRYTLLERGQQDWSAAYTDLMKRVAALQFGDQKNQIELLFGGYEVLNDSIPVSPDPKKSCLIGLALALALAISLPIGLEYANSSISQIPVLESRLGIAGLGMVPMTAPALLEEVFRSPALGAKVPNYLLECFRVIRSNILLNPTNSGSSQVLCITSAKPGEGKSTLAANLAWAFYSMGERTLLVDTDLRRGRVHEIVGLDNQAGLASYFSGAASENQIVQSTIDRNLDVVTRGPFIPGASEFLCRKVFEEIVQRWRSIYDRIILDGPPVLGLSETTSTQRVSDGVVLVVKAESTRVLDVETTVDQLKRAQTKFFGFVLNRLDLSKMANHYYYYYYSPNYYTNYEDESFGLGGKQTVHLS